MKTLEDISKLISSENWRIAYHFRGANVIKCGSSDPTRM